MIRALIFIKQNDIQNATVELNKCSSIREKVFNYIEAAQWLILYHDHLQSIGLSEGVKLCLDHAKQFAIKTQNFILKNEIEKRQHKESK